MYQDALATFASGQSAVSSDGVITPGAYSYDKGAALNDLGVGEPLFVVFTITEVLVGGTTITFSIVDDDNAALSSPAVLAEFTAALATFAEGYQFALALPQGSTQRYLGVGIKPVGANVTDGNFSAFLTHDVPKNINYPAGSTIV